MCYCILVFKPVVFFMQRKMTDKLQNRVETLMEERETLRDRVKNLMVTPLLQMDSNWGALVTKR